MTSCSTHHSPCCHCNRIGFFHLATNGDFAPFGRKHLCLSSGVVDPGTEVRPVANYTITLLRVTPPWHSFWHTVWRCLKYMVYILTCWHSGIYSDVLSDILSGILSGIYSGILHIWHLFWHSLWHTLELAIWQSPGTLHFHSIWSWWYASECSKCSKRGGGIGERGQDEGGRGCGRRRRRRGGGGRVAPLFKSRDPHLPGGEKETWKIHGLKAKW